MQRAPVLVRSMAISAVLLPLSLGTVGARDTLQSLPSPQPGAACGDIPT